VTRFIYLSDTHLGADPLGYYQQTPYPERLPEILTALDAWIQKAGNIDFIIHGGDMIDCMSDEQVQAAGNLFRLSVPVYLCLGNHDLTTNDSLDRWLKLAPQFFPEGRPEYAIDTADGSIYVLPNHWSQTPYFWGNEQKTQFSVHQESAFTARMASKKEKLQVFITHSPVFGLPPEQTLLSEPLHEPALAFSDAVKNMIAPYADLRCVLGGHNHMNMHIEQTGVHYVTVSALVESPFECKLFEMQANQLSMTTMSLIDQLPFSAEYDQTKTFVQGRRIDRSFQSSV
jgi:hypothetical protein